MTKFVHPIKAIIHLTQLAKLTAAGAPGTRMFTLNHHNLSTTNLQGRK